MDLDPRVYEALACPNCHAPFAIDPDSDEFVCTGPGCGLIFPFRDGFPHLLIDEARQPGADERVGDHG